MDFTLGLVDLTLLTETVVASSFADSLFDSALSFVGGALNVLLVYVPAPFGFERVGRTTVVGLSFRGAMRQTDTSGWLSASLSERESLPTD